MKVLIKKIYFKKLMRERKREEKEIEREGKLHLQLFS